MPPILPELSIFCLRVYIHYVLCEKVVCVRWMQEWFVIRLACLHMYIQVPKCPIRWYKLVCAGA